MLVVITAYSVTTSVAVVVIVAAGMENDSAKYDFCRLFNFIPLLQRATGPRRLIYSPRSTAAASAGRPGPV